MHQRGVECCIAALPNYRRLNSQIKIKFFVLLRPVRSAAEQFNGCGAIIRRSLCDFSANDAFKLLRPAIAGLQLTGLP
jgi:hypothetical protein